MTKADGSLDWRAVSAIAVFLVAMFTVTSFLTDDKIDSKVQQHEIITEGKRNEEITSIKEDLATVRARQESMLRYIEEIKVQNTAIINKLNER